MPISRREIRRLEHAARGEWDSFPLLDGSRYFYDTAETYKALFLFAYDLQLGRVGEVPEFYQKLTQARDPAEVLQRIEPDNPAAAFVNPSALFDRDILVRERRLVPLVAPEPEDLSEGA
jgi:hypothetical protein